MKNNYKHVVCLFILVCLLFVFHKLDMYGYIAEILIISVSVPCMFISYDGDYFTSVKGMFIVLVVTVLVIVLFGICDNSRNHKCIDPNHIKCDGYCICDGMKCK